MANDVQPGLAAVQLSNTSGQLSSQLWQIVPTYTNGYYRLIAANDRTRSINVLNNSVIDNSAVNAAAFSLSEAQQWRLVRQ